MSDIDRARLADRIRLMRAQQPANRWEEGWNAALNAVLGSMGQPTAQPPVSSQDTAPAPRQARVWVRGDPDNPPRPEPRTGITLRNDNGKTWTQRGTEYFAPNAGPHGGWRFGGLLERCTRLTEVLSPSTQTGGTQ